MDPENVDVRPDQTNNPETGKNALLKFILFSAIGIFLFFIPVGESNDIPMVHIIDWLKELLGGGLNYLVLIVSTGIAITFFAGKLTKAESGILNTFKKFYIKEGFFTGILYLLAMIFSIMLVFNIGPEQVLDPDVGGLALSLSGSVLLTVTVAGWLVTLIIEFGALEFLGTLMEPIMRRLYKVPGKSAVDALASFVSAPAVGVFITSKLYTDSHYTEKEACCITTNFSVCSLGFFAVLVSIGGIVDYFPHVIASSLVIVFIMAAIVIRVPPLSWKTDEYFDGTVQSEEDRIPENYSKETLPKAVSAALEKAGSTDVDIILKSFVPALLFAVKIVAYVISIATVSLLLAEHTPLFTWLGMPMIPILNLLRIPDAAIIAPSTLVGIAEIALPVILISGAEVAEKSIFFIVVLSTVQIIFFTESANAMLESDIPLNFLELVAIFLIRTLIAMPLVAGVAHLLF